MIPRQDLLVLALVAGVVAAPPAASEAVGPLARNPSGYAATVSTQGRIDRGNPFFSSLGTNGRSCESCHVEDQGWSVTPAKVRARFDATQGTDPIFRTVDGADSPNADVSSVAARRRAYSMLMSKALIRVGLPMPPAATSEFDLVAVDDPYGFASAAQLSLFRRPLPSTNLKFLSTVMWDGRETFKSETSTKCLAGTQTCFAGIHFDLRDQSNVATHDHAQATQPLTDAQQRQIVAFETSLFTAQVADDAAGLLFTHGAHGGPVHAATIPFHFGINDALAGDYRTHAPFDPSAMTLYQAWAVPAGASPADGQRGAARAAVARGEALFNTKAIRITGVGGLNDDLDLPVIQGTCTTCHDTPNVGNHSLPLPLDIGVAHTGAPGLESDPVIAQALAQVDEPGLPVFLINGCPNPFAAGHAASFYTTDPGKALLTGQCSDLNRLKGPVLRGLAARAPYFHNGAAATLLDAVNFYDQRFQMNLTPKQKQQLVAFLNSL